MKRNEFILIPDVETNARRSWYSYYGIGFICGVCFDLRWINLRGVKLNDVKISTMGKILGDE